MAKEPATEALEAHPHCVVCGRHHPFGLHLRFALLEDGSVQAAFDCEETFQGYPGVLHGGVVSSLLDGAMTHCLFAHGEQAVTGELQVRFSKPVVTEQKARVRAWIDRSLPPFHVVKAELIQNDMIKAKATGKFVKRPAYPLPWAPKKDNNSGHDPRVAVTPAKVLPKRNIATHDSI